MNDDRFLDALRREPRREFARALRERIDGGAAAEAAPRRLAPLLAGAFAALAVAALFVFPSVRASAQAFLDLFRVRNFVAVNVDAGRFEKLDDPSLDLQRLIGDDVQVLQDPGEVRTFPTAEAAAAAAGIDPLEPTWLPSGFAPESPVKLSGEGRVRITADAARLRELMTLLDVRDAEVPSGLDGAVVEVHAYPSLQQSFRGSGRRSDVRVRLMQARSPEVALPAGVDLAQLAEVGLRMLGIAPADARRLARTTDWRSTLLVPVPVDAASFVEVNVDGARGLLVTKRTGGLHVILWAKNDRVFALSGAIERGDLLQMASSIR